MRPDMPFERDWEDEDDDGILEVVNDEVNAGAGDDGEGGDDE